MPSESNDNTPEKDTENNGEDKSEAGRWEIGVRDEPISKAMGMPKGSAKIVIAVHQPSYFILGTNVFDPANPNGAQDGLREIIAEAPMTPSVFVMCKGDIDYTDHIQAVADEHNIPVERASHLKALPQVLSEMTKYFNSFG